MTSLPRPHVADATPRFSPLAGLLAGGVGLSALAGLWFLSSLLVSMPQSGAVETGPLPHAMVAPSSRTASVSRADTTVPDASTAFASGETSADQSVSTF